MTNTKKNIKDKEKKNILIKNGLVYLGIANKSDSKKSGGGKVTRRQFFLYIGEHSNIKTGTDKFYLVYLNENFNKITSPFSFRKAEIKIKEFTHFTENTDKNQPFTYYVYNNNELVFNLQGSGIQSLINNFFEYMFSENTFVGKINMAITFIDESGSQKGIEGEEKIKTISLNSLNEDVKQLENI